MSERSASYILLERLKCQQSLHEFSIRAWPQIEGSKPFIDGWHLGAICEHLEAVTSGQIKKLLINISPRTGKTNFISVMWPAWVFINHPSMGFLFSSYSKQISLEHSRRCKMLIESPWYQNRWGHIVKLSPDQASKGHFVNTAFGYRVATSVGAGGTGLGGNIIVQDDTNNAKDGESKITRDSTNDWVARSWSSRLNPGGDISAHVIVQQRVHEMDVSGFTMSQDTDNEWVRLIVPMEFEPARRAKTIALPSTEGKVWEDPRTEEGELMCPQYLGKKEIASLKISLGRYNYAGQYQQRPEPEGGGIIRREDFRIWTKKELPPIKYMVQSWDTALTDRETSDYTACTTWGTFLDENKVLNVILLYAWRDRVNYSQMLKRAVRLQKNCKDIYEEELPADRNFKPDVILIEAKAAGHPLISDLVTKGISVRSFNPGKYGDKTNRVHLSSPFIECGRVWVASQEGMVMPDHEMVIGECVKFPKGEADDLVDTLTQAILFLSKEKGMLTHVLELDFKRDNYEKEKMPGYSNPGKGNR